MAREAPLLAVLLACLAAPAAGQDEDAPDLRLLEYLGSWQESDEEWLVVAGIGGELDGEAVGEPAGETAGIGAENNAGDRTGAEAREDRRDEN